LNPLTRKVNIRRYSIPLLLLLLTTCGTVAAVSYIVLSFNINVTVQTNPKVTFWQWNPGVKANTFDYSVNIFPSIKTIDENATYGIFCDDTVNHDCQLRISNIVTASNIDRLYIKIYNSTATVYEQTWTSPLPTPPTTFESFTVAAGQKYSVWLEITGSSGASGTSTITFEMKVLNP